MTTPDTCPWAAHFPHLGADRVSRVREYDGEPLDDYDIDRIEDRYLDARMGFREDPR